MLNLVVDLYDGVCVIMEMDEIAQLFFQNFGHACLCFALWVWPLDSFGINIFANLLGNHSKMTHERDNTN